MKRLLFGLTLLAAAANSSSAFIVRDNESGPRAFP